MRSKVGETFPAERDTSKTERHYTLPHNKYRLFFEFCILFVHDRINYGKLEKKQFSDCDSFEKNRRRMMSKTRNNYELEIGHAVYLILKDLQDIQEEEDLYSIGEKSGMVNALKWLQLALVQDWDNKEEELERYDLNFDPEKYL